MDPFVICLWTTGRSKAGGPRHYLCVPFSELALRPSSDMKSEDTSFGTRLALS